QDLAYASHRHSLGWHRFPRSSSLTSRAPCTAQRSSACHPLPGWPTSHRNGRDQIGIGGRLHSGIGGRLPPEYALRPVSAIWPVALLAGCVVESAARLLNRQ